MRTPRNGRRTNRYDRDGADYACWREAAFDIRQYAALFAAIPKPCPLAVDAGCGSGTLAVHLARVAQRVVGFDLSLAMLALSRRRFAQEGLANVSLVVADALRPPFRPKCAGMVLAVNLLHHMDLSESLSGLASLVADGGCLAARDLVAVRPRLEKMIWYRVLAGIRRTVRALVKGGPSRAAAAARFLLSPRALASGWDRFLTPQQFEETCHKVLPGARVEQPTLGAIDMVWSRPD